MSISEENDKLTIYQTLAIVAEIVERQAYAIYQDTKGIAIGALPSSQAFGAMGRILNFAVLYEGFSTTSNKEAYIQQEAFKFAAQSFWAAGVTTLTLPTGPAAPLFGFMAGALVGLAYDKAFADANTAITSNVDPNNSSRLITLLDDGAGKTLTIDENLSTGEALFRDQNLNSLWLKSAADGSAQEIEVIKGDYSMTVNLLTGHYEATGADNVIHTGNLLTDPSINTNAQAVMDAIIASYTADHQVVDPAFDLSDLVAAGYTLTGDAALVSTVGGRIVYLQSLLR